MPSVVHPSSSDFPAFPVFAPVRQPLLRKARGVGAVSATPLPPSGRLSALYATPLPLGQDGSTPGSEWGENPCATVFRPFFTVFDRFSGGSESRFARRIRRSTVFAGRAAVKKTVKPVTSRRMKPVGSSCADSALDVPIVTNLGLAKSHSKKHLSAAMPPKQEPTGQVGLPHQAWVLQWATTTSRSS